MLLNNNQYSFHHYIRKARIAVDDAKRHGANRALSPSAGGKSPILSHTETISMRREADSSEKLGSSVFSLISVWSYQLIRISYPALGLEEAVRLS